MFKNHKRLKWIIVIILGVIALAVGAFFVIQAMIGDGSSYKEYGTEQTADGITVKLNSVERLPMTNEKCLERIVLIGNKENFTCVIANVTITNNTDKTYDYSYRNFGYRDPRSEKILTTSITNINFKGIDVTKDITPSKSHTQDVLYSIQKKVSLSDLKIIYKVDPKAGDGGAEIALQL